MHTPHLAGGEDLVGGEDPALALVLLLSTLVISPPICLACLTLYILHVHTPHLTGGEDLALVLLLSRLVCSPTICLDALPLSAWLARADCKLLWMVASWLSTCKSNFGSGGLLEGICKSLAKFLLLPLFGICRLDQP